MPLRSVSIYVKEKALTGVIPQTESIELMFMRELGNIRIAECSQINIMLTTNYLFAKKLEKFGTILDYYYFVDIEAVPPLLNSYSKKEYVLHVIVNAIFELCDIYGWDKSPFDNAKKKCLDKGLINEWWFKNKLFRSPNHQYYFGLLNVYDIGYYEIFEVLLDKNKNEITRRKCFRDTAKTFSICWASWNKSNDKFFYKFNGPKKVFVANIEELLAKKTKQLSETTSEFFK